MREGNRGGEDDIKGASDRDARWGLEYCNICEMGGELKAVCLDLFVELWRWDNVNRLDK